MLTVNAPLDVVKHYDLAGVIDIIAAANSSYHEYGTVGFVKIAKGRIAIEENSQVSQVHIKTSEITNEQTSVVETTFDEIIVSIATPEVKPAFSRDDVEIAPQGTLVVALQSGTTDVTEDTELDYVWLTKQGIFEQIKVSDNNESMDDAEWADTLSAGTTKAASFEIANNITRDNNNDIDVKVSVTESETTKTYQVSLDANRNLVVVEENAVTTENPIATLKESGVVIIQSIEFKVELANNNTDKSTELKVTNLNTQEVVETTKAVEQSGLNEEKQQEAINTNSYYNAPVRNKIQQKGYSSLKQAFDETNNYDVIEVAKDVKVSENIVLTSDRTTLHINDGITLEFVDSGYIRLEHKTGNANTMILLEGTGTIKNSTDDLIFRSSVDINQRCDEIIDITDITVIGDNFSDCKLFIYSGYFMTKLYDESSTSRYSPFVANEERTYIYGGHFIDSASDLNNYLMVGGLTNNGNEDYQVIVNPSPNQTSIKIIYEDENRGTVIPKYINSPSGASFLTRFYTEADPTIYTNNAVVNLNCTIEFLEDYTGSMLSISAGTYYAKKTVNLNNHTFTFSGASAFAFGSNKKVKISNGVILTNTENAKIFQASLTDVTFENVTFSKNLLNDMFNYIGADDYIVVDGDVFTISSTRPENYNFVLIREGHSIAYHSLDSALADIQTHDTLHLYENANQEISIAKNFLFYVIVENNVDFPTVVTSDTEADIITEDISENKKSYTAKIDYSIEVYNGDVLLKGYKNINDLNTAISYCGYNTYKLVLQKNIELTSAISLTTQKLTIDLNGHIISSNHDVFTGRFSNNTYYINIEDNSSLKSGKIECTSGYLFNLTSTKYNGYSAPTNRLTGTIRIYGGALLSNGIAVYYDFSTTEKYQNHNYNFVNIEIYSGAKLLAGTKMATTKYKELNINSSLWTLTNYSSTRNINAFGGAIIAGNDLFDLEEENKTHSFVRVATDSSSYNATTIASIENVDNYSNCYIVLGNS